METFESVRTALGLDFAKMLQLMRNCGMTPNANAEFTAEQVNQLYAEWKNLPADEPEENDTTQNLEETAEIVASENKDVPEDSESRNDDEPEIFTDSIETPESENEHDDGDSETEDESDNAENEETVYADDFYDREGEETFEQLAGLDNEDTAPSEKSDWLHADDIKRKFSKIFAENKEELTDQEVSERLSKCLEEAGITIPEDGMFSPEQVNDIENQCKILYDVETYIDAKDPDGGETRGVITDSEPDKPARPFVSDKIPRDDYIDAESEPSAGSTVYTDKEGTPYILLENVDGGSGTEGTIYVVKNLGKNPPAKENLVAKIYAPEYRTKRREAKIRAMIRLELIHGSICFPSAVLTDKDGNFVGFLMMKAEGMKLTSILEKLRKHEPGYFFSNWNRKDLNDLIISVLNAFKFLHDNNILLGDVCLDNIMAAPSNRVYIVDTDSCQILPRGCTLENLSDEKYLSEREFSIAGYPCPGERVKYNSPEFDKVLREYDPSEIFRTKDDELFALSVLLFEIVMIGRWPYDRVGTNDAKEAKARKIFHYPQAYLTRKILNDNRSEKFKDRFATIPPRGLLNLPQENLRMWDHLPYFIKSAFRNAFAGSGSHNSEGKRFTADDWLGKFLRYRRELKEWADNEHDPANADLFPELFCKLKYKTDDDGNNIKDENGNDIEIHYVECRFCHDRVDREECRGEFHDECALCWEEGTVQTCTKCRKEFLITRQEVAKSRKAGRSLRRICDDCREDRHRCSEGHTFTVSGRTDNEMYARFRTTLWAGQKKEERDYSMYCPKCFDLVMCEICHEPVKLTKRERYEMERDGKPFSSICPHCKPVKVTCEECGETFEIQQHVKDELERNGQTVSSICPNNPEIEAICERCGNHFVTRKHIADSLKPEGKLYTQCPMGEKVKISCKKCESSGQFAQYDIERYWAEDMKKRGEDFDCGKHKGFLGFFGSSGSVEPSVNHRDKS